MKKIVALNLVLLIIISLCGCTFADSKTVSDSETSYTSSAVYSSQTFEETTTVLTSAETTTEPATTVTQPQNLSSTTAEYATQTTVPKTTVAATKESESVASEKKETTTRKAETTKKQEQTESASVKCTIEISCKTILDNKDKLKDNKKGFVPKSGMILNSTEITVPEGSTAFDVLKKACEENVCTDKCSFCRKNGIQLDFVYTPGYDSNYIRGVHQIYEKDCGPKSGWLYSVNGAFQNFGCSKYIVNNGDVIRFIYTCDLGDDI